MALDATVGGASANSYGTLAEADAYFDDRPDSADWDALGSAQEGWLIAATDALERLTYQGKPTTETQALAWPRYRVRVDGYLLDDWEIPARLKSAQFMTALLLSEETDHVGNTGLEDFERLKVDVIEIVPRASAKAGTLPDNVLREVAPLLASASRYQFRIARG